MERVACSSTGTSRLAKKADGPQIDADEVGSVARLESAFIGVHPRLDHFQRFSVSC
jgi:hypothetical protein